MHSYADSKNHRKTIVENHKNGSQDITVYYKDDKFRTIGKKSYSKKPSEQLFSLDDDVEYEYSIVDNVEIKKSSINKSNGTELSGINQIINYKDVSVTDWYKESQLYVIERGDTIDRSKNIDFYSGTDLLSTKGMTFDRETRQYRISFIIDLKYEEDRVQFIKTRYRKRGTVFGHKRVVYNYISGSN